MRNASLKKNQTVAAALPSSLSWVRWEMTVWGLAALLCLLVTLFRLASISFLIRILFEMENIKADL